MIGQTLITKTCPVCGRQFQTVWPRQKYCSDQCRFGTSTCIVCGKQFIRKPRTTGKYCSRECWYAHYRQIGKHTKICPVCGKPFHGDAQTCSRACGYELIKRRHPNRHTHCEYCGKPLPSDVKPGQRFCSRSCAMKARNRRSGHTLPLGTKRRCASGYIQIKVGKDYPGAWDNGWMFEHRYVMQEHLGRILLSTERIHHKNGKRDDNRLANLELWTISPKDPPGQRLFETAQDMVRRLPHDEKVQFLAWLQELIT